MALVTMDILSEGEVETACSALVLEKGVSVVDNEVEVLCCAWVAANKGQSLVLQPMQTKYRLVCAAHKEELAELRRAATENSVLSLFSKDPSSAAALLDCARTTQRRSSTCRTCCAR